jgi:hypothetical protein
MRNKIFLSLSIMLIAICLPTLVQAQPDPGPSPDVPIDGGLSILLAAGVAYGTKKVHDSRKKKQAGNTQNKQ